MSLERLKLLVILGSNSPGRVGERVAQWVLKSLETFSESQVDYVDLAEMELGLLLSTHHSRTGISEGRTKELAAKLGAADAFIIVAPGYNHGYAAILKHAIDSVYAEWFAKAGSIVSYRVASAGLRASEQIRQVLAELRTHITRNGIAISGASQKIKEDGTWTGDEDMGPAFKSVVDELYWWASALKDARQINAYPA
jgi:NAD(P)H-dependent FMN reductase